MLGLNQVRGGGFNPILWSLVLAVGFIKTSFLLPQKTIPQTLESINDTSPSLDLHYAVLTINPQPSRHENITENANEPATPVVKPIPKPGRLPENVEQEPRAANSKLTLLEFSTFFVIHN